MPKKKTTKPKYTRKYFDTLSDTDLDALWKDRVEKELSESEVIVLRTAVRERKGFQPVEVFVSICQRCNLPADNCACQNT